MYSRPLASHLALALALALALLHQLERELGVGADRDAELARDHPELRLLLAREERDDAAGAAVAAGAPRQVEVLVGGARQLVQQDDVDGAEVEAARPRGRCSTKYYDSTVLQEGEEVRGRKGQLTKAR